MKPEFIEKLKNIVGASFVLTSEEERVQYGQDWTRTPGKAGAVVLPKTTSEVASILKLCSECKVSVIPSGGRTGLAGAITATQNELALNLSRMNQIGEVDTLGRTVRVQAGVTTQALHEHCEEDGLTWPVDLAAKGTSQIGGNLSTNAGGVRVIRYGMARRWVSAIQAVLISGEVIELNQGLEKNNTGYDLLQLLIGSEGTLAVITEATLKLCPPPIHSRVFLFSLRDYDSLQLLYEKVRRAPFTLTSFEFFSEKCLKQVDAKLGRNCRLGNRGTLLALIDVEVGSYPQEKDKMDDWLSELLSGNEIEDGLAADSSSDQVAVWSLREGITESLQMSGLVRKYDLCVPVKRCADFLKEAEKLYKKMQLRSELFVFGHFVDGSPHLNFLNSGGLSPESFHKEINQFEIELYPLLKAFYGSVSAEHGVGVLKKNWVVYSRTPAELNLYRALKKAFDPEGLLNPGKITD
ncbi:MAG: FAD-binding oxidoreductase [Pseudomonadota bacterium]